MRTGVKRVLASLPQGATRGVTALIYHRVGGGTTEELDLPYESFRRQTSSLLAHDVVALDVAMDALDRGDTRPRVVLTFDDGFADVYRNAWPLLRDRNLPFTIYLTTAYVGGKLQWPGSTAREQGADALTWDELAEMVESGLCTIGNHTHTHARPELLGAEELDQCTEAITRELGVNPKHFAFTWGVPVPAMGPALRARFRTAATGRIGRNLPSTDRMALRRVPVRRTDPIEFFEAKLEGDLLPERMYSGIVAAAKKVGLRG